MSRLDYTLNGCALDGDTGDIWGLSELAKPRQGRVIPVSSQMSIGIVSSLAAGIILFAILKTKKVL